MIEMTMEISGTRLGLNGRAAHELGGAGLRVGADTRQRVSTGFRVPMRNSRIVGVPQKAAGFTMVEIAISLAIIGFALVAIIGALPLGLKIQRANREQTIINQDATVFMQAISRGARGLDDLTNYVYAITNYWAEYNNGTWGPARANGYTFTGASVAPGYFASGFPINSGERIVGLLSTPEYTDANGNPLPDLFGGGYSNHVVAYVYSLSGPAVEKPPQANDSIVRQESFSYRMLCVNAPFAHYMPPLWTGQSYVPGATVSFVMWNGQISYWQANTNTSASEVPTNSVYWNRLMYPQELDLNTRELRLTFLWPQLPTGGLPPRPDHVTFRTLVAGQLALVATNNQALYFYQPQIFTSAP
jgi:type II secretory pathway pseudopilin PulG